MGKITENLGPWGRVRIKGCMPELFLNICVYRGIEIISAGKPDAFSLDMFIPDRCISMARELAGAKGFEFAVLERGRAWRRFARRRIIPAFLAVCLLAMLFWSKFYIWDISVEGNESVSTGRILSALSSSGVKSGAFWPGFSADNIRSEVLARIPELSWITVNMKGSHAQVLAVERQNKPDMVYEGGPASIRSCMEGFIKKTQVLEGTANVKSGDLVKKDDVLISGVIESSFAQPSFTRAQGSIIAETNREFTAIMPSQRAVRRYTGDEKQKIALIIGNNRINFYSDSSFSDDFCDKITYVWRIGIPGLFSFPVSIVCETYKVYVPEEALWNKYEAEDCLSRALYVQLEQSLGEGRILSDNYICSPGSGVYTGCLRVRAQEEVGVICPISPEEIYKANTKYNEKANDE